MIAIAGGEGGFVRRTPNIRRWRATCRPLCRHGVIVMRRVYVGLVLIAVLIAAVGLTAAVPGCGGSGNDGDRQGTATTEADVIINFHNRGPGGQRQGIDSIVVQMQPGDEAFLSTFVMATHIRPDLTTEDFPIDRSGAPTTFTVGGFDVPEEGPHWLVIHEVGGSTSAPMRFVDTATNTDIVIGEIRCGFRVDAAGVVLAPTTMRTILPTQATTLGSGAILRGLPASTWVKGIVDAPFAQACLVRREPFPGGVPAGTVELVDLLDGMQQQWVDNRQTIVSAEVSATELTCGP